MIFRSPKDARRCDWLIRQFASEKHLIFPKTIEEDMALSKNRKLDMQYRDGFKRVIYPTQHGWDHFIEFVKLIHNSEPFVSRATLNDTYQALNTAFARMLGEGQLPDTTDELLVYLPSEFPAQLTTRSEQLAAKLNGVHFEEDYFIRVANCWIGRFVDFDFAWAASDEDPGAAAWFDSMSAVFERNGLVILTSPISGTSEFAASDATYQFETALSVLSVMLNMSYESAFGHLWQVRHMDRPERGYSKHFSFSMVNETNCRSDKSLSIQTRALNQHLTVDQAMVDRWHSKFGLALVNNLVAKPIEDLSQLESKWRNAVLFFGQSATQRIPDLQLAMLWTCIESLFVTGSDDILDAIIPGLLAVTVSTMPREFWPGDGASVPELQKVFKRQYASRSRTYHHGRRGHVSQSDVQQFSHVVCNVIVSVAQLCSRGMRTTFELSNWIDTVLAGSDRATESD